MVQRYFESVSFNHTTAKVLNTLNEFPWALNLHLVIGTLLHPPNVCDRVYGWLDLSCVSTIVDYKVLSFTTIIKQASVPMLYIKKIGQPSSNSYTII